MSASNWVGFLGAIGALIVAVFSAIHGQRVDNREAGKTQQQLETYIMEQVKQDNEQLRSDREADRKKFSDDLAVLGAKKDAMEQELNQQIALKVRENEQLKQQNEQLNQWNAALEKENEAYRKRYGRL
ncbi:hypothetical protein [Levilactobacillus andaensis]|uniref:hypothetical protein n=1 Tax=Levilactobacillus andaensis TaxID=2799570 RepID=UPI0019445631|nr:hypothetical protein [Levilactobacillus andaensis]